MDFDVNRVRMPLQLNGALEPGYDQRRWSVEIQEAHQQLERGRRVPWNDPLCGMRIPSEWDRAVDHLVRAVAINIRVSRYHYVLGLQYGWLEQGVKSQAAFATFERLEREASELEGRRRAAKRDAP